MTEVYNEKRAKVILKTERLFRLPDSGSKDSVLRFFVSDQTMCERKTNGNLRLSRKDIS